MVAALALRGVLAPSPCLGLRKQVALLASGQGAKATWGEPQGSSKGGTFLGRNAPSLPRTNAALQTP